MPQQSQQQTKQDEHMINPTTKKPILQPDQSAAALAHATSLQEQLLKAKHPQIAQNSPQNAPEQEIEGKQEDMAEGGKEEPKNGEFETQVLDELASLKAEVEQLLKGEEEEKQEEAQEEQNEPPEKKQA